MQQLRQMLLIAQKDLKLFVTDRIALFFFILFPLLFVIVFNFMLADVGGEDERLTLHLATQENDGLSHQILAAVETGEDDELRPGQPRIIWLKDYDEARRMVENKEIEGFLAFPADFSEGVLMGYGARLGVTADAEAINTRAALYGLAQSIASQVGSQQVANSAIIGLLVEQGMVDPGGMTEIGQAIQELFSEQEGLSGGESFMEFRQEKIGEVEAYNPNNYLVPGYLVMFTFFAAALSAEMIVRERQNHTLERLMTGSMGRESILGGIFVGTAVKGLIQIAIFWTVGLLAFRIDLGIAPVAVILISILVVIMSASFGIMLAILVKTQRAAGSIAVLTSLILAPLGGCWWPLFITPRWIQALAKITPHGWATTGFNKLMLFGADFTSAVPEMLALVGFAVVFGTIAMYRFRAHPV
jgi:ABC-2 type transport system permease protein